MKKVLHNSYTMFTRGSPDIYTLSPRACGPRVWGVHIRQTTCAHGITIKYCPTLDVDVSARVLLLIDSKDLRLAIRKIISSLVFKCCSQASS